MTRRVDPMALAAVVLLLVTLGVYVGVMRIESDRPVPWFVGALLLGAVASGYGTSTAAPHRASALVPAGSVLLVVGALAILSVGFPIVVAGGLCLLAAARSRHAGARRGTRRGAARPC